MNLEDPPRRGPPGTLGTGTGGKPTFLRVEFDPPEPRLNMNDIEYAKQLKDEGFPQIFRPGSSFYDVEGKYYASKIFSADEKDFGVGEVVLDPPDKEFSEWLALDPDWTGLKAWKRDESDASHEMTCELASQLNDAGFCAGKSVFYYKQSLNTDKPYRVHIFSRYAQSPGELLYPAPTLSQLIEACEQRFLNLARHEDEEGEYWKAEGRLSGRQTVFTQGDSPEEAVARLWLVLGQNS
jgi:hypothetical protein